MLTIMKWLLIVAAVALTLPLGLSRLMGYQMLGIVSGDMAPAIPGGSVIYVQSVDPSDLQVDEVVLFPRYVLFCFSHCILFCACEWMASARTMPLSPFVGPTASAVTTSMYLPVFGIPSEMVLLAITFFLLGFHGLAAIRAPEEERAAAVFKMLYSMSLSTVVFSAAVLLAAVLNCLMTGVRIYAGLF